MFQDTVTLFHYHEKSGLWYLTECRGVQLGAVSASQYTRDAGTVNGDTVELLIQTARDRSIAGKRYVSPKEYAALDDATVYFTFRTGAEKRDFFLTGTFDSPGPINSDEYGGNLYHILNDRRDGVYLITSAAFFSLIPHFEIGGR